MGGVTLPPSFYKRGDNEKKIDEIETTQEEIKPKIYRYRWVNRNNVEIRKISGWVEGSDQEVKNFMTAQIKGSFGNGAEQILMKKEVA